MKRIFLAVTLAAFVIPATTGLTVAQAARSTGKNMGALDMRVNAVCRNAGQHTGFADPAAAFDMCWRGARDGYNGNDKKCVQTIAKFESEGQNLTGAARAEFREIGHMYRVGCNIGKSSREAGY